ncbi:GIY-YIG nuclease family protein [Lysobacter korlensis]|uniref:GIY-YIG nuclease family protein n=1 Tax=Lysobacter korlensis TaxID=553636 RepID=A0ABV6RTM0_9GAMM
MTFEDRAVAAPPELRFTEHVIEDGASLALMLPASESRTGIYWLDFADGYSYVGQSVAVRSRLATHRRRWADAVRVKFAPCAAEDLDRLEVAAIRHAESLRVNLRNKLLTGRPGGGQDTIVEVREGVSLALPWDRARRGGLEIGTLPTPTEAEQARFARLQQRTGWEHLAAATSVLIREAVPAPTLSQRALWTVSALPSTGQTEGSHRMLTLSAGRLEILRVHEVTGGAAVERWAWLNLTEEREPEANRILERIIALGYDPNEAVTFPDYGSIADVAAVGVELRDLPALVREQTVLDAVYRLVVTAMRQGSAPLGRHHNQALANELLLRASR